MSPRYQFTVRSLLLAMFIFALFFAINADALRETMLGIGPTGFLALLPCALWMLFLLVTMACWILVVSALTSATFDIGSWLKNRLLRRRRRDFGRLELPGGHGLAPTCRDMPCEHPEELREAGLDPRYRQRENHD
jgi:hypothetical protein